MAEKKARVKKASGPIVKPDLPAYLAQAVPVLGPEVQKLSPEEYLAFVKSFQDHDHTSGIFSEALVTGDRQEVVDELLPELATLVALLAQAPGGVSVFGHHFDYSGSKEAADASA